MKENFIPSIVNFNTDDITEEIRKTFARDYLSNPEYTYERINRANQACGPLVKWAIAQLEYAEMLNKVDPLRQELKALEDAAVVKKQEASRMSELIKTLEASINRYKEEYAALISQAEAIKTTLKQVQGKVNRPMGLLLSLGIEKDRWGLTSDNFKLQMTTSSCPPHSSPMAAILTSSTGTPCSPPGATTWRPLALPSGPTLRGLSSCPTLTRD